MNPGADQPNRADPRRRSILGDGPTPDERPEEPTLGLFESAPTLRAPRPSSMLGQVTGPIAGVPIAPDDGAGPRPGNHGAAGPDRPSHLDRRVATSLVDGPRRPTNPVPFRPITSQLPVIPTPPLERMLDVAHRWRSALGVALAALITTGVVIAYQRHDGSETATADLTGVPGQDRSAIAAVTDFSTTDNTIAGPVVSSTNSQAVNSAVDEVTSSTATTVGPSTSAATPTTAPTSTASTTSEASSSTTTPATEPPTPTTTPTTGATPTPSDTGVPAETTTTDVTTASTSTTMVSAPPVTGRRVEAETAALRGTAQVRADHQGYEGTGFVGDLITPGSGLSVTVDVAAAGDVPFTVRYAAGPAGNRGLRTLTVQVDGVAVSEAQMQPTGAWTTWEVVVGTLPLAAGANEITLVWAEGDTGWVNIDYLEIG